MKCCLCILLLFATVMSEGQERTMNFSKPVARRYIFGIQVGTGWTYEDEVHLFSPSIVMTLDYHISEDFFIQFAPGYSWLLKWNEHYLTLPLYLRKKFDDNISLFAGPALTFDVGYMKDLGVSAGVYLHLNGKSALVISTATFNLYDYHIDNVPVNFLYWFSF